MKPTSTTAATSPTRAMETEATLLLNSNKSHGEASASPQSPATTTMPPLSDQNASLNRARRWMYVSHAMNQFSEWAWQFCLILFLAALTNYQSLLLVSTYGVTLNAFVAYGLPRMGRLVDRAAASTTKNNNNTATSLRDKGTNYAPRLTLIRLWIFLENSCVLLATACCWYLFQQHHQQQQSLQTLSGQDEKSFELWTWLQSSSSSSSSWIISTILLIGMHVLGAMAQVLDKSVLLALERDWVVVMSTEYAHQLDLKKRYNENSDDSIGDGPNHDRDEDDMGRETSYQIQQHKSSINTSDTNKKDPRSLWLSQTNVIMKQIDLSCQISAPALSGWFIAYWTTASSFPASSPALAMEEGQQQQQQQQQQPQDWSGAVFWVGTVNVIALIVEWICLTHIYHMVPALAAATASSETVTHLSGPSSISVTDEGNDDNDQISNVRLSLEPTTEEQGTPEAKVPLRTSSGSSDSSSRCYDFAGHALHVYFCEQSTTVSTSGLGLSFLYFNVLTFGGMMTAYLITLGGMSITTIGFWRGVSSAIGLAGTLAFDVSHRILGYSLEFTGLWSIIWEFVCLSISVLSLVWLTTDPHRSMVLLIAGVLPSRIGLYAFDITITTLMQERVAPSVRGLVGGTQTSLNSWMSLLPYGMGMIYSEPRQFHVFVVGCYVAVGLAMILYIVGVYGIRESRHYPHVYQSLS
jgi:hypothetical protein